MYIIFGSPEQFHLNVLECFWLAMYKPKILVLGLAIAISIFSLAYINLAIAQTEQTEGFTAALSGGKKFLRWILLLLVLRHLL